MTRTEQMVQERRESIERRLAGELPKGEKPCPQIVTIWQRGSRRKKDLPRCGAVYQSGHVCRRWPMRGKKRCRLHGGLSTGPKTPEGRARIAQSNRRRRALLDGGAGPDAR